MAESKRFLLRMNPELFEALRRWADDDMRSINAQIEYLLADQARRAGRLAARKTRPPRAGGSRVGEDAEAPTDDDEARDVDPGEGSRGSTSRTAARR